MPLSTVSIVRNGRSRTRLALHARGEPWLYTVGRLLLAPAAVMYGRFTLEGAEELPSSGPLLLVVNHPSDIDPILVALPFRRPLKFMTDAVQFERPFVGWCMRRLGAFAIDRSGRPRAGIERALELLDAGEAVVVFPEGDVMEGTSRRFERGIAFLAAHTGAPLLPLHLTGAELVLRGDWWRRLPRGWRDRPHVRLRIGAPLCVRTLPPREYAAATRQLEELVMEPPTRPAA